MALERLTQITEVGIQSGITLRNVNVEGAFVSGVVTATTLNVTGGGANFAGVVTATSFSGNVTGNITPTGLVVSGVSTFQSSSFWGDGDIAYFGDGQDLLIFHNSTDSIIRDNGTGDLYIEGGNRIRLTNPTGIETYGVFNQDGAVELYHDNVKKFETTSSGITVSGTSGVGTALLVNGDARIVGIFTVGTGSITLNGTTNQVNVGTGVTIHHTNGFQIGSNTLHSTGLTVNSLNASGVITATSFSGSGANLTGIAATTNVVTNSLVVSGVSTFAAGSVSAPSITPSGDSNTGVFFPAADTIAFAEGGTESARFDSSGRLLLGTATSDGSLLSSLQVTGSSWASTQLLYRYDSNAFGPSLYLGKSRSGTIGTKSLVSSGDELGNIVFYGADGSADRTAASIQAYVDNTSGANDMPGRLVFSTTADGSSSLTERMRVDSAGRILGNNTSIFATGRLFTPSFSNGTVNLYLFTGSQPSGTGSYNYYQQLPAGTQGGIYEVAAFGGPEYANVGPGCALIYALFSVNYNGVFSTIASNVRINPDPGNPAFMNASWNTSTNFVFASWGNQGYQNYPMLYFRRLGAYL